MLTRIEYSEDRLAPEEHLAEPDSAMSTGYAESKWVSEQILKRASEKTLLSATVIRCGQMTGGPSGAWNDHEWFPSLIKSSVVLGMLPDAKGVSVSPTFRPFSYLHCYSGRVLADWV